MSSSGRSTETEASKLFARWAPGIAQAVIYAYFAVMFSREYFVNHKPWYYALLAGVCVLVSLGMISLAIYKTVLEDKIKESRRAIDVFVCPTCGGDGYTDGSRCSMCMGSGEMEFVPGGQSRPYSPDLRWVAGGQVRRLKKSRKQEPDSDPDKEPFGVKGSL